LQPILEDTGVGSLTFGVGADVENPFAGEASRGGSIAENVDDGDAGEVGGAELIDGDGAKRASGDGLRRGGLLVGAEDLLADVANCLLRAQAGSDEVAVVDGENLSAGVEVLGEAGE
jgi:hypothetical protein